MSSVAYKRRAAEIAATLTQKGFEEAVHHVFMMYTLS